MPDREKVIKGLERCKLYNKVNCDKCPYDYNGRGNGKSECTAELAEDALALLKEQNGKWVWKSGDRYMCSVCGMETSVDEEMEEPLYAYCPFCGAKMEWGGRNGDA